MEPDAETVERLRAIASSYIIESFGAKPEDDYSVTDDGILFAYRFGDADADGVPAPGDGGRLLVRWDGRAFDSFGPLSDSFELPDLPMTPTAA